MTTQTRTRLATWGLFGALVAIVLASYWRLALRRAAAASAAENLEACAEYAAQIAELRDRPSLAALEARSPTELARRIEEAAANANLPSINVLRIDPQAARRVGDTSYKEQPTSLELQLVTLKQLITFLLALTDAESGLEVSTLRLTAPRSETARDAGDEAWQAEVTLTYLIFSPKTPRL